MVLPSGGYEVQRCFGVFGLMVSCIYQKLWEKLTSDPDVAAKCQILDGKSDEEKLHSMLNEEFWGVDVDEESGLVYGPFKHAFKCIAKYVAAAWKIRNAYAHPSDVA